MSLNSEILESPIDAPNTEGALTCRYPDWRDLTLVPHAGGALVLFPSSQGLTTAGDVHILPTPGHSPGHRSLLLDDGEVAYLFVGDISFDEDQLVRGIMGGISLAAPDRRGHPVARVTAAVDACCRTLATV